jgi:hypothetical protein
MSGVTADIQIGISWIQIRSISAGANFLSAKVSDVKYKYGIVWQAYRFKYASRKM